MRPVIFDAEPTPGPLASTLPIRQTQRAPRAQAVIGLALLLPLAGGLAVPVAALGFAAASGEADVVGLAAANPLATLQIAFALSILAAMLGYPITRLVNRLATERHVVVSRTSVDIIETGLFGRRRWSEPLAAYQGLVHHIRTSMSGARHELVLVHADARRSVLLAVAPHFSAAEVLDAARLIGVSEIPANCLYGAPRPVETAVGVSDPSPLPLAA